MNAETRVDLPDRQDPRAYRESGALQARKARKARRVKKATRVDPQDQLVRKDPPGHRDSLAPAESRATRGRRDL